MKEGEIRNELNIVSKPPGDEVLQQIYYASSDGRRGSAPKRQNEEALAPELICAQKCCCFGADEKRIPEFSDVRIVFSKQI